MTEEIKAAFSIEEFCSWASIGRSLAYKEIEAKRLLAKKVGRRTVIPLAQAIKWLESLPDSREQNATKVKRS